MGEEWRDVVGYEGSYEVSSEGRVRSLDRVVTGPRGRRQRMRGRVLKPGSHIDGYQLIGLFSPEGRWQTTVHRLVLEAFVGPCPPGYEACHGNGDPADNRAVNLRWGTHSDNVQDQVLHGTHPNASKDVCPRGHALLGMNLVPNQSRRGVRCCRACGRAWSDYSKLADHSAFQFDEVADAYFSRFMKETVDA